MKKFLSGSKPSVGAMIANCDNVDQEYSDPRLLHPSLLILNLFQTKPAKPGLIRNSHVTRTRTQTSLISYKLASPSDKDANKCNFFKITLQKVAFKYVNWIKLRHDA